MDLDEELQTFQQKYTNLAQQSTSGSVEQHVYSQIVGNINSSQNAIPATQRAFETQIALVRLAKVLDPPGGRDVVWQAIEELERIAELPPLR
jgi:hypothetical protein